MSIRIEGIGDGLSEPQRNALAILTNLPVERFGKLKKDTLKLNGSPDVLDAETLAKLIATAEEKRLDLSNEGVIRFKDIHLPAGNQGRLRGVIGKDPANAFYDDSPRRAGLCSKQRMPKGRSYPNETKSRIKVMLTSSWKPRKTSTSNHRRLAA